MTRVIHIDDQMFRPALARLRYLLLLDTEENWALHPLLEAMEESDRPGTVVPIASRRADIAELEARNMEWAHQQLRVRADVVRKAAKENPR